MSRKILKTKKNIKRIKLKRTGDISGLFDLNKPLYYSNFALTDDHDAVLFFIDDQFIQKNELKEHINDFNLSENDLHIKFNNQRFLKPKALNNCYLFEDIGMIKRRKIDWFFSNYPNCVFHPITEWFGKSVNTLIIVLVESFGKVVGVVKTYN
jgi:hypothetical protein